MYLHAMIYLTADELDLCAQVRAMCACNQLRRTTRDVNALYESALAPSRLTVTQLPILVGLGSAGDLSVSTLADALSLDRTTLTRNLRELEDRGLIRTSERENDARVRMVSLTLGGADVLAAASPAGPGRRSSSSSASAASGSPRCTPSWRRSAT